ncbi:hypothetical protein ACFQ7O_33720 [Streptomyces sp. NPDC056485]
MYSVALLLLDQGRGARENSDVEGLVGAQTVADRPTPLSKVRVP